MNTIQQHKEGHEHKHSPENHRVAQEIDSVFLPREYLSLKICSKLFYATDLQISRPLFLIGVSEFVFNIPPTTKVIWRWGDYLGSNPTGGPKIEHGTHGYKVSGLFTIPQWLLLIGLNIIMGQPM